MNGLDLFSGIGGLSFALREYVRPIGYCESERYAQAVLLSRMSTGDIPVAPIWDDVRTLRAVYLHAKPEIIYGGFPCQDISVAGLGAGLEGKRSGLFREIIRLTREIEPAFTFVENVPAIRTRGLDEVVRAFTDIRYDCRWTCVSAREVGAPHIRKRWFLLAHANGLRLREEQRAEQPTGEGQIQLDDNGASKSLANSESERERKSTNETDAEPTRRQTRDEPFDRRWWEIEPDVGRVADGVPARVDRLRGLGNAVVPLQAQVAFKRLCGLA